MLFKTIDFPKNWKKGLLSVKDVNELKRELKVGDAILISVYKEKELADGRLRYFKTWEKVHVVAKYKNLVEVAGEIKRNTVKYEDILIWKLQKEQERRKNV